MTGAPAYMRNGCADIAVPGGRDRYDRGLSDLVGELSTRSEEFGTRWAARNVRRHRTGRKQLPWAVAGVQRRARVSLPGRLDLLASWAATLDQLDPAATAPAPDQA